MASLTRAPQSITLPPGPPQIITHVHVRFVDSLRDYYAALSAIARCSEYGIHFKPGSAAFIGIEGNQNFEYIMLKPALAVVVRE